MISRGTKVVALIEGNYVNAIYSHPVMENHDFAEYESDMVAHAVLNCDSTNIFLVEGQDATDNRFVQLIFVKEILMEMPDAE